MILWWCSKVLLFLHNVGTCNCQRSVPPNPLCIIPHPQFQNKEMWCLSYVPPRPGNYVYANSKIRIFVGSARIRLSYLLIQLCKYQMKAPYWVVSITSRHRFLTAFDTWHEIEWNYSRIVIFNYILVCLCLYKCVKREKFSSSFLKIDIRGYSDHDILILQISECLKCTRIPALVSAIVFILEVLSTCWRTDKTWITKKFAFFITFYLFNFSI